MNSRPLSLVLALLSSALLSACLESGGGSTFADSGGIHGTGVQAVQVGPIDAFGSVFVNGIRYETNGAVFLINGQSATQDDLAIGQVIRIEATSPSNTAMQVEYVETVKGPVQSIDLVNNRFVALGQTVQVTSTTAFDGVTLATLLVGDVVEVSNLAAMQFNIAGLKVTHNVAGLQNGQLVDVIGLANDFNIDTLIASEIRTGFAPNPEEGQEVEVEGIITNFTSATLFEVNGLIVETNANTQVEGGLLADLALGVRIEVEGIYLASGRLLADHIEIKPDDTIEIRSIVEAVDSANNTITLLSTTFSVNSSTSYKEEREPKVANFGLDDIAIGDDLSVDGAIKNGIPTLTSVERKINEEVIELQGPVTEVNAPTSFKILDFNILPAAGTVDFNQLAVGKIVKAKWEGPLGTTIPPKEIEIED